MRHQQCLLLAAFACAIALGCRKDKDSEAPVVRITSPGEGYSVSIPDTLLVGLAVSDDRIVRSVSVMLTDADGVPVAPSATIAVEAASREFTMDLPVLSERIASGQYVLSVQATDGVNEGRAFLGITVQAAPLRVRSMFLVPPADGAPPFIITRIDSTGTATPFAALPELSQAVAGLDHLFTAGAASAPLERRRISSGAVSSIMPNPGLWPQFFTSVSVDAKNGRIHACGADGSVRGFTGDGAPAFTAALPVGSFGDAVAAVGDAVLCSAYDPVSQQKRLIRFGGSSGALLAQFDADARALAMYEVDAQRLMLFGNASTGGVIQEVSATQGGAFTMRSFPGEEMLSVARVSPSLFVIATSSGIKRFDYPSAAVTDLLPGTSARGLTYDPVSGSVIAAHGSAITAFDPLVGTMLSVQTAPHPVASVRLQLNR